MADKTISKEKLEQIVARLETRRSTVKVESRALGFNSNTPLRKALCDLIGRDRYFGLLQSKGPRVNKGEAILRPRPEDKDLPVIAAMTKSAGWRWRHVSEHELRPVKVDLGKEGTLIVMDGGARFLVMISPEGTEYTEAFEFEKADILLTNPVHPDGVRLRFVEYARSDRRKQTEKNTELGEEQLKRGEAALQRKREKNNAMPPQDPVYAAATKAVAENHPRSTRLDPKPKKRKAVKGKK